MGVNSRARISSTACYILFSTSEYVSDMLHAMVVDESMIWAGGRGAGLFLLDWDYGSTHLYSVLPDTEDRSANRCRLCGCVGHNSLTCVEPVQVPFVSFVRAVEQDV
jgi:hypothetical protein